MAAAARAQLKAVDGLWGQLVPMTVLFFCMAFVNTLLDAVKVRRSYNESSRIYIRGARV